MDKKQAWIKLVEEKSHHYLNLGDGGFDEMMKVQLVRCNYEEKSATYSIEPQKWQINEKGGIHGGAIAGNGAATDIPYRIRMGVNVEKKKAIAEKVAATVSDGQRIMLDASSTAIYITRALKNKKNMTVITNSVEILLELADKSDWNVFSTGGVLKEGALSLNGSSAERMIRSYHVDVAICSCKGIDAKFGITDSNEKDAQIKQAMFASAERRLLALDYDKFDRASFVKVCDLGEIDTLVTDCIPGEGWENRLSDAGIEIIY